MDGSVLGKRRVGDEFTASQKRLMREPIMDVAKNADLQEVTGVDSPELDDRTLRQMGNERPYKLKNSSNVDSMPGLGNSDIDLGNNPFGLNLDEPLPQSGGRKSRRNKRSNKRKSNKRKSHKKRSRRNKKGSRRNRK